ncbi:MAG: tetratricopeptide repeat protein [Spirochaetales bacterium]|nr:tetratricopeptide repeat protein [Spirochaetales bacterium]
MRKGSFRLWLFFSVLIISFPLSAESPLFLSLTPAAEIPLGPKNTDDRIPYSTGVSGSLTGEYLLGRGFLSLAGFLDYNLFPTLAEENLSIVSLGAGGGVILPLFPWLNLRIHAGGGYGLGLYQGIPGGSFFFKSTGTFSFRLSSAFSLGISGGYRYQDGLYSSTFLGLHTILTLSGSPKANIEFQDIRFDPVFPVFYHYYNDHPLGSIRLKNDESGPIKDLKIYLFIKGYMDKPKLCAEIPELKRGEERTLPLYALFNRSLLGITEGTRVNAEIKVSYNLTGDEMAGETDSTVEVYDRNAMTWDDDRKAASFVTAKDPTVLSFGKRYGALVRNQGNSAISRNLKTGMGMFQALVLSGVNYVIDPKTPYRDFSENKFAVDYLQFPVQTLQYQAGDCDDLSILYCALMESVGIETAFITVPGHIFAAFALEISPEEVHKTFRNPEAFILQYGLAWVPVEVTALQGDFLQAWNQGVQQWRKHESEGLSNLIPIHEAWQTYNPVGFESDEKPLTLPTDPQVLSSFTDTLDSFIQIQLGDRLEKLQKEIRDTGGSGKSYNKLALLYARFGVYPEAETAFKQAAATGYLPAEMNLGNIFLVTGRPDLAVSSFSAFLTQKPDYPAALAGLARAHYDLRDFSRAEEVYRRLAVAAPEVAESYAYLSDETAATSRAAEGDIYFAPLWNEE